VNNCPTCGLPTPEGNFCVRCGAPLDHGLAHARHRQEFAAAPRERRYAPWLVSTLFPQLPRHSERHFHIALAVGAALVIVLGAARLFPVGLISAAILMPLLTLLYFYDVDIYEGEPAWAAAWTVVWGGLAGVGFGLLAHALAPSGTALIDKGSTSHVIVGGIVLPGLGVLVMLAGPLMLLERRRFNQVLDGASFGAATAATFAAAQAIVVGVDVLKGGLRPPGAAAPWIERLVGLAVATPVLSMSAVGAATAAVWLRYRAPVQDRGALGVLGQPVVAVPLAGLLVIAGAIGETFMAAGTWLAYLVALDLIGLVLLRRALHVGLLEEAAEGEIGPPIRCVNCQAMTPVHTFCNNCGIALKALPKVRPTEEAVSAGESGGRLAAELAGRRSGHRRLLAYGAALAAVVGVAFAVGALAARRGQVARCKHGSLCGNPPLAPRIAFAFPGYTIWRSTGLGFSLRYPSNQWSVSSQDANDLALQFSDGSVLIINAASSSSDGPAALIAAKLSSLRGQLLGLAADSNIADQLLGTNVGFIPGPGGVYTATITTPQGPQTPVHVALLAATNAGVSIVATVVTPNNLGPGSAIAQGADDIINSIDY
jgi:hypothetical protein